MPPDPKLVRRDPAAPRRPGSELAPPGTPPSPQSVADRDRLDSPVSGDTRSRSATVRGEAVRIGNSPKGGGRRHGLGHGQGFTAALTAALPVVFLLIFFAWPVLTMLERGILDGTPFAGVADVLTRPRTWRVIGQTFAQATLGTAICVAVGLPVAYLLYRTRFPGRGALRAFVTIPFVLPTVVVGVAFRALLASNGPLGFLGLDGTFTAIILALVFFNISVVVRTVGGMWERLDPRTAEAAAALGSSPARVFRTVTLPSLAPAIASAASVVFLFCATAYGVVLVLGGLRSGTVETEIYLQTVQFLDLRAAAVLSVVQVLIVAAALYVSGKARAATERAVAVREAATRPLRLTGTGAGPDRVALGVTAAVVGFMLAPMLGLVAASLRGPDGWGLANYANLAGRGTGNALNVSVWTATGNSLRIALIATLIAVTLGTLLSIVLSRRPRSPGGRRALGVLDASFMAPLGVSAVTVGFGLLITMNREPFDLVGSPWIVPIAQAVVALPLVVRVVLPVLRAIDPRQREAAAVLGASPSRVFATVEGPHLVRSLGLAVGFAFAVSLGEFGATSFLARPTDPTLPVVIYRLISRPGAENFGMAMAACVVLALLTATVMAVAERARAPHQEGL